MPTTQIKAVDNYERAKKIVEFYEGLNKLNITHAAKKARINKINKAIEEKTLTLKIPKEKEKNLMDFLESQKIEILGDK